MICDLCKPLNPGEGQTIRIIMSADEARWLSRALSRSQIPSIEIDALSKSLCRALDRTEETRP